MTSAPSPASWRCARRDGLVEDIDALAGLAKTNLPMAFVLAMLMFSMAGIPPLAGFFAKFYVFAAAIKAGLYRARRHRRAGERGRAPTTTCASSRSCSSTSRARRSCRSSAGRAGHGAVGTVRAAVRHRAQRPWSTRRSRRRGRCISRPDDDDRARRASAATRLAHLAETDRPTPRRCGARSRASAGRCGCWPTGRRRGGAAPGAPGRRSGNLFASLLSRRRARRASSRPALASSPAWRRSTPSRR